MIVTLAGHVDHGKTALVRALSGVETDRLAEEQRRGLTIDLGFAYIDAGTIGFVDVPGHHRFIHNMVAGIAHHQHALLVIAADDGPMPQSREHLDILNLLGLQHGSIVLSKSDVCDTERLEQCRQEIRQLVASTFLANAPIFTTSTQDPGSIESVLMHLRAQQKQNEQTVGQRLFRLAVDRTFTIKGAGLVATGTVHCGQVQVESTCYHFPSGKPVRVRSIRAQDRITSNASSGERCAVNLTGLAPEELSRGDWLLTEPSSGYQTLHIRLQLTNSFAEKAKQRIKHWLPVHIYHNTSHTTGRLAHSKLADPEKLHFDLVLEQPIVCQHGDRLILRDQGLDQTIGGGEILFAEQGLVRKRNTSQRRRLITAHQADSAAAALDHLLSTGPVDIKAFQRFRNLPDSVINEIKQSQQTLTIDSDLIHAKVWSEYKQLALDAVKEALAPDTQQVDATTSGQGMRENGLPKLIPPRLRLRLLNDLVSDGKLDHVGGWYQLSGHKAALPTHLEVLWKRLGPLLNHPQAPSSGDLAKQFKLAQGELEIALNQLVKYGLLVRVAEHRYYPQSTLQELAKTTLGLVAGEGFSVAQFRDHTGIGRNIAIEILEYFDSRGFTRREGNFRKILRQAL